MMSLPRLRTTKRFSSSSFSDVILADRILLILSWSDHRSSRDIASRSIFFIDISRPCILRLSSFYRLNVILLGLLLRKWPTAPFPQVGLLLATNPLKYIDLFLLLACLTEFKLQITQLKIAIKPGIWPTKGRKRLLSIGSLPCVRHPLRSAPMISFML